MARQRTLPKRPSRSRIQTCIQGEVHERVDLYCAHYGLSEARFIEMAALEKLNGMGDAKTTMTWLRTLSEQQHVLTELVHHFLLLWLQNTQLFTPEEQQTARPQTRAVYQRLVQQLQTNLSAGEGFIATFEQRRSKARTEAEGAPAPKPRSGRKGLAPEVS